MKLKKVILENFKSYEGRHEIEMIDRYTCVIGPNGSGKSNIMDAISFGLGINSMFLRCNSLDSLISTSQNSVQVDLIFNDFSLKREYKNKKSTYFVNLEVVGFEKFKNFLEEKNIFIKLRNFLCFQSDLTSIAVKTPKELTKLVEELSGSLELKEEYDVALIKQNSAIRDCVTALEAKRIGLSRIKEMKGEEEKRNKFENLIYKKEQLGRILVLSELFMNKEKLDEISKNLLVSEKHLKKFEASDLLAEIKKKTGVVFNLQKEILKLESENDDILSRKAELKEKIVESEIFLEKHEGVDEIDGVRRINEICSEIRKTEGDLKMISDGFLKFSEEINNEIYDMKSKGDLCYKKEIVDQFETEREIFEKETNFLSQKLNELKLKAYYNDVRSNKDIIIGLNERLEGVISRLNCKNEMKKTLNSSKENYLRQIQQIEKRGDFSKFKNILERIETKNCELNATIEKISFFGVRSKNADRKNKIKDVVEVLKGVFSGVIGRVVDVISVTQSKYEVAISGLMDGYDQAVVVENDDVAIRAVEYLRRHKLNKLSFIPLNKIKIQPIEAIKSNTWAVNAINVDERCKSVGFFLFGNSVIVNSAAEAKILIYSSKQKIRVVTLDGTVFKKKTIKGGEKKNKFEESKIEELISFKLKCISELKKLNGEKDRCVEFEFLLEKQKKYKNEEMRIEENLVDLKREIKNLEDKIHELRREIEDLKSKNETNEEFREEYEKINLMIRNKENEIFKIFRIVGVSNVNEFLERGKRTFFSTKTDEFERLKNLKKSKIEILKSEIFILNSQLERGFSAEDELLVSSILKENKFDSEEKEFVDEKKISEFRAEFKKLMNLTILKISEIERISENFGDEKLLLENLQEDFEEIKRKKILNETEILRLTSEKIRCENLCNEMLNYAYLEEIDVPNNGKVGILGVDFQSFDHLVDRDLKTLKDKISDLGRQIDFCLPGIQNDLKINVTELNEKYENLKSAAIKSKEEFNDVKLRRIEIFQKYFEILNSKIGENYKKLVGDETEGNAFFAFENSEIIFEDGLKFYVMAPKKRFREIGLLSGGEKIMACLAFIFTIHLIRPAPFYIFDELDSALDSENVCKLVEFYKSIDAQIVVITLKSGVYESSEALVGVYKKNEKSKILTYKLT